MHPGTGSALHCYPSHLSQEMGAGATLLRISSGIYTIPTVLPKTIASTSTMVTKTRELMGRPSHTHTHRDRKQQKKKKKKRSKKSHTE